MLYHSRIIHTVTGCLATTTTASTGTLTAWTITWLAMSSELHTALLSMCLI